MAGGFKITPGDLHSSGSTLENFGNEIGESGKTMQTLGQDLVSHASQDQTGVGAVIVKAMGKGTEIVGKVFSEGGRVATAAGKRLHSNADAHLENEAHQERTFKGIHDREPDGHARPRGGELGGGPKSGDSAGGVHKPDLDRSKPRGRSVNRPEDPDRTSVPDSDKNKQGDPVDIATGDVTVSDTDLRLAGALPLVLSRTHVSSYRAGRWFGPSWASTLDQRLEIDGEGVLYFSPDGMILVYPHPGVNAPVLPASGPRLELVIDEDGRYVLDAGDGNELAFASVGDAAVLPLASMTDRNGATYRIDYTPEGAPAMIRHSGGYRVGIGTEGGRVTGLWVLQPDDSQVMVREYRYDDRRRLAEVINPSGRPLTYDYDFDGRLTGWQDRNGMWYRYEYDADGRCVHSTGTGDYLEARFSYDPEHRITVFTDALGNATTFHLDERGRTVRTVDALGGEATFEWDRQGRLLRRVDPVGRTTTASYDEDGNLLATTLADGTTTRWEYDEDGLPVTQIDPTGARWSWEYDDRGNLAASIAPDGARTAFGRDERGFVTSVTDALGNTALFENDAAGNVTSVTDPLGAVSRYAYDSFGRLVEQTDEIGLVTRYGWYVDGKRAWVRRPDGSTTRWALDNEANAVAQEGTDGRVDRVERTAFDLPSAQIGPDGGRIEFTYDKQLRLVAVTNPQGLVWRYEYDALGRMVRQTDFNGRVQTYAYDAAGRMVERVNGAGEVVSYRHDVRGNVIEQRSGDQVSTFEYDAANRLVAAANADSTLTIRRDARGRVIAENCDGREVVSEYDALNRRVRRRTPSGAESVWEYDANDQPISLQSSGELIRFGYDPASREVERRFGARTLLAQTWGMRDELVSQTITATPAGPENPARLVQRRVYGYRPDGALVAVDDDLGGSRRFTLDRLDRITMVQWPGGAEQYDYDGSGNITAAGWPVPEAATETVDAGSRGVREYSGTLLTRAGNVHYRYDAHGRLVQRRQRLLSGRDRIWHYRWDPADRLVGVTTPDGSSWRYRYDPMGRRIAKELLATDGSGVAERTTFVWDDSVLVEQAHTVIGTAAPITTTTWDWQPGGFEPITQLERALSPDASQAEFDRRFYAIVTDQAGAPSELIGTDGAVAWRADRTTWGSVTAVAEAGASTPLRFPGQYHDPETGFDYNYFRYYEPGVGRYASNDLIGLMGGLNPQSYVVNPFHYSDPLGLMGKKGKGGGRAGSGGNAGSCHDHLVRLMSDDEKKAMEKVNGLVPKPGTSTEPVRLDTKDKQDSFLDGSNNKGDGRMKWLLTAEEAKNTKTKFGDSDRYTWRADIHLKPNHDGVSNHDWLNNWENAARKGNEPNRYGILPQQLDSFNSRIDHITWTRIRKK